MPASHPILMPASIRRSAGLAAAHHCATTFETTPSECAVAALTAGACMFWAGATRICEPQLSQDTSTASLLSQLVHSTFCLFFAL